MLVVISPAKKQNTSPYPPNLPTSAPIFQSHTALLLNHLKSLSPADVKKILGVSDALGALNYERYQQLNSPEHPEIPALFCYQGDVFQSLRASTLPLKALEFAQSHLFILSGLYGLLRAFDRISPHRLDMNTILKISSIKSLRDYWKPLITTQLNLALSQQKNKVLINLASAEYANSIDREAMACPIVDIKFREKNEDSKTIPGALAKIARGAMARFILENQLDHPEPLKEFSALGYQYEPRFSSTLVFVFAKGNRA